MTTLDKNLIISLNFVLNKIVSVKVLLFIIFFPFKIMLKF